MTASAGRAGAAQDQLRDEGHLPDGGADRPPLARSGPDVHGGGSGVRYADPAGRRILAATVLGSAVAQIDGLITTIALPAIGEDLHAGIDGLTWVVNAYTLTLASLILLGGSLGDRFGRRRVFVIGVIWFTAASVLCAAAPNLAILVFARAVQGVGGALLVPGSLALIQSSFRAQDRARAVGAWSGLGGLAAAAAPLLGGWLLAAGSWRWIFLVNVPVAALVLLGAWHIPESRNTSKAAGFDVLGGSLFALALTGLTLGLSRWAQGGLADPAVGVPLAGGVLLLGIFLAWEHRAAAPLLPPALFRSRLFAATNAVTFAVYGALGGAFFWLLLHLQLVIGLSPVEAGSTLLPATVLLLLLSAPAGAWGQRVGPRLPMTLGPAIAAVAVWLLAAAGPESTFLADLLGPVLLLGLGLVITVAPLTATALASAPDEQAGVASGVNNTLARAGGLLVVALLPTLTGVGDGYTDPRALDGAYQHAMWACAGLLAVSSLLAATLVRPERVRSACSDDSRGPRTAHAMARRVHCAVDAPPVQLTQLTRRTPR